MTSKRVQLYTCLLCLCVARPLPFFPYGTMVYSFARPFDLFSISTAARRGNLIVVPARRGEPGAPTRAAWRGHQASWFMPPMHAPSPGPGAWPSKSQVPSIADSDAREAATQQIQNATKITKKARHEPAAGASSLERSGVLYYPWQEPTVLYTT